MVVPSWRQALAGTASALFVLWGGQLVLKSLGPDPGGARRRRQMQREAEYNPVLRAAHASAATDMDATFPSRVELAFKLGRRGAWDELSAAFQEDSLMGAACVRTGRGQQGETLLHIAAAAGDLRAARMCVRLGADVRASNSAGLQAADLAERAGATELAAQLRGLAAETNSSAEWHPGTRAFADWSVWPSSPLYREGRPVRAANQRRFSYNGGGSTDVPTGRQYWADSWGRGIIGCRGTVSPPLNMDGEALCPLGEHARAYATADGPPPFDH